MKSQLGRVGLRSVTPGSGRRDQVSRLALVLLVGTGLAALGLWVSSFLGQPAGAEPLVSSLARQSFAPGFGVASAAIMVMVWTSSSRRAGDGRELAAVQHLADGALASRSTTARRADVSMAAPAQRSTFRDVRQAHTPRPELRSETGARRVSWTGVRASTGLRYAGVATSELRRPMSVTGR